MNYCKRKNEPTDTVHCLNCEHCLPPGERTGGRMCRDEYRAVSAMADRAALVLPFDREVSH